MAELADAIDLGSIVSRRAGSSPVIRMEKESEGRKTFVFFLGRIASWNLRFKVSASLRSAQSRGPPDLVRPVIRTKKESEGQKTLGVYNM